MSEPLDHGSDPGPQSPSPSVPDDEVSTQRGEEHGELEPEAPLRTGATEQPHDAASDRHALAPTAEPPAVSSDAKVVAPKKAKRTYVSIPDDLELTILKALMANVRAYRNKRYDLVREAPEFVAWIGRAQGEAGKKRFRRLLDQIVAPKRSPDRPGGGDMRAEQEVWAAEQLTANAHALGDLAPSVAQVARGGLPVIHDIMALQEEVGEFARDVQRVRDVALVYDPTAVGGRAAALPELLLKTAKIGSNLVGQRLSLYDRQLSLMSDHAFLLDLTQLIHDVLADHPHKRAELVQGMKRLARKHGGRAPAGSQA